MWMNGMRKRDSWTAMVNLGNRRVKRPLYSRKVSSPAWLLMGNVCWKRTSHEIIRFALLKCDSRLEKNQLSLKFKKEVWKQPILHAYTSSFFGCRLKYIFCIPMTAAWEIRRFDQTNSWITCRLITTSKATPATLRGWKEAIDSGHWQHQLSYHKR